MNALIRLSTFISLHLNGSCKSLSFDLGCEFPHQDLYQIVEVLRWYSEQAHAISCYNRESKEIEVCIKDLQMDAGKRAEKVIGAFLKR